MRVWFVPLLMLSVLIGWTLGLAGCALSAGQGWDPPPGWGEPLGRMTIPGTTDPLGGFDRVSMVDPSVPSDAGPAVLSDASDAGASEASASDAGASDAGTPVSGTESIDAGSDAGRPHDFFGRCGDGTVQFGELCDDGNTAAGDGCSALCLPE